MKIDPLFKDAVSLLQDLIRTPSFSKEENETASLLFIHMNERGLLAQRVGNNIWVKSNDFDSAKPTLLLNSHHDTVKPNQQWTVDPFAGEIANGKLIGLGSNDAGASLVSLLAAFQFFNEQASLPFNIIFAATAEEEISGTGGIESIYTLLEPINFAIVGEPTKMEVAIAEKGLLVLDCVAHGKSGHAARDEGDNAILNAMKDIAWFSSFKFEKTSPWLGDIKMSVTQIESGSQHNVIPDMCKFTVDVRVTEMYTHEEILEIIRANVSCDVKPRSTRIRPSGISSSHAFFQTAIALNKNIYGSPTTSDQALIPAPSIKMGPGDSARSHTADEFILLEEIRTGIEGYIEFISTLAHILTNNSQITTANETLETNVLHQ